MTPAAWERHVRCGMPGPISSPMILRDLPKPPSHPGSARTWLSRADVDGEFARLNSARAWPRITPTRRSRKGPGSRSDAPNGEGVSSRGSPDSVGSSLDRAAVGCSRRRRNPFREPCIPHLRLKIRAVSGRGPAGNPCADRYRRCEDGQRCSPRCRPMPRGTARANSCSTTPGPTPMHRAGGNYYPKLQISVPFTPATGPRILVADERKPGHAFATRSRTAMRHGTQPVLGPCNLSSTLAQVPLFEQGRLACCATISSSTGRTMRLRQLCRIPRSALSSRKRKDDSQGTRRGEGAGRYSTFKWLTGSADQAPNTGMRSGVFYHRHRGCANGGTPYLTRAAFRAARASAWPTGYCWSLFAYH